MSFGPSINQHCISLPFAKGRVQDVLSVPLPWCCLVWQTSDASCNLFCEQTPVEVLCVSIDAKERLLKGGMGMSV